MSTTSASISSSRRVLLMDECASEPRTTHSRPVAPRFLAVSRATASADRLPAEPPDTKQPPDEAGRPASRAITRSTLFSAAIGPDASSHEMPWIDAQDTSMSNNRLAFVGAAGMKPRNLGLSAEITLGAITDAYTPSTSSGCRGASRIKPSRRSYSSSAGGALSRAPGSSAAGSPRTPPLRTICSPVWSTSCGTHLYSIGTTTGGVLYPATRTQLATVRSVGARRRAARRFRRTP